MIDGGIIESRDLGECEGFKLTAYIIGDDETIPEDRDVYTQEALDTFEVDWFYVTLAVVASREGIVLGHAYLNEVEHGWFPVRDGTRPAPVDKFFINALDSATDPAYDLIAEAVADARKCLASLIR